MDGRTARTVVTACTILAEMWCPLEQAGNRIGPLDVLIAGHALNALHEPPPLTRPHPPAPAWHVSDMSTLTVELPDDLAEPLDQASERRRPRPRGTCPAGSGNHAPARTAKGKSVEEPRGAAGFPSTHGKWCAEPKAGRPRRELNGCPSAMESSPGFRPGSTPCLRTSSCGRLPAFRRCSPHRLRGGARLRGDSLKRRPPPRRRRALRHQRCEPHSVSDSILRVTG